MGKEIWKEIDGFSNYMISNFGRVKSLGRWVKYYKGKRWLKEKIRKSSLNKRNNYLYVVLFKEGKPKGYSIHRLVAEAFIPNPDNLPQVNHKDEDKTNNCVLNLEWCDEKYNVNWGTSIKRRSEKQKGKKLSEETKRKISESNKGKTFSKETIEKRSKKRVGIYNTKKSKPLLQIDQLTNEVIKEWESAAEVERQLGIKRSNISECCRGKRKTASGFKWIFL